MNEETGVIDAIVDRAREAQRVYENMGSQALFDSACQAVAWVLMEPERNRQLAELAVAETGLDLLICSRESRCALFGAPAAL